MRIKNIVAGLLMMGILSVNAQNNSKEVLFKIDNNPYYTDEFVRVYNKNLDLVKDDSQKNLDHYLDLFIGYKLKVNKAQKLELDKNPNYIAELNSYRNQLAKKYLTDSKVTKELVQEAYDRSLKEVNASHILIMIDENASPADTLKAYHRILDIRKKAVSGTPFEELANQYSEDKYGDEGVHNGGNLGYFSAFRMVYPFENGAFQTKKGEVSKPIRSQFGYHIIKVNDVRESRGSISVAHILVLKKLEGFPDDKAKQRIEEIYAKIKQGENFAELAKQFSDDKNSAPKGGKLATLSSGESNSMEFEDAAFSLSKENPISKPIETPYGYHIIQFLDKVPVKSFAEMEADLESKIKRDERSILITNSLNDQLKAKYKINLNKKNATAAIKLLNENYYSQNFKIPTTSKILNNELFSIKEQKITIEDFLKFVEQEQNKIKDIKPLQVLGEKLMEKFTDFKINTYYNENLENEFADFANAMGEYKDGLLLFDLMDKEVWEKAKTDTIGLQKFYEKNIQNYTWKKRFDVTILSSTNEEIIKKAHKFLKQKKSTDFIKQKLNTANRIDIIEKTGVFEQDHNNIPQHVKLKKGLNDVFKDGNYFYAVQVNDIIEEGNKKLEECKGKVINDYQQHLEDNMVSELKKEFKVTVDPTIFEKVKKQIKK